MSIELANREISLKVYVMREFCSNSCVKRDHDPPLLPSCLCLAVETKGRESNKNALHCQCLCCQFLLFQRDSSVF